MKRMITLVILSATIGRTNIKPASTTKINEAVSFFFILSLLLLYANYFHFMDFVVARNLPFLSLTLQKRNSPQIFADSVTLIS
jgi:hypothetical protein